MRFPAAALIAVAAAFVSPAFAGDKPAEPAAAPEKDWTEHKGDIPFIVGREAGLKEVEFTGKPIFYFYTATW